MNDGPPEGYAEMMDKLKNPADWDIPGIIGDISQQVGEEYHNGGEVLAVIDSLFFAIRRIDQLIRTGKPTERGKIINADTIREASEITKRFAEGSIPY